MDHTKVSLVTRNSSNTDCFSMADSVGIIMPIDLMNSTARGLDALQART